MINIEELTKKNELFFWCNCSGDISLPGDDPNDVINPDVPAHTADELPDDVRHLYETFLFGDTAINYVVTLKGTPGLLLTGFYDINLVSQLSHVPMKGEKMKSLMERVYGYLYARGMSVEKQINDPDCMVVIGYYSSFDSHELSLFIPGTKDDDTINKYIDFFEDILFNEEDEIFLRKIAEY